MPTPGTSNVLDSLDALDSDVEIVEAPLARKSSPFFQDKNKTATSVASTRPSASASIDDGLEDIDWDAWDADVLNHTSSSASRKRSMDPSETTRAGKKRTI